MEFQKEPISGHWPAVRIIWLGVFGSCHLSSCQPLPYPWLLPATQIMDSGQRQFLIYWLQAKQRVTAVFSNQQKDLWCLPSAALCQRHLASPGFVAPPQKIFLIFPATWGLRLTPRVELVVGRQIVLLIQNFTFLASSHVSNQNISELSALAGWDASGRHKSPITPL